MVSSRVVIRGDTYSIRRPLYRITLLDDGGAPFDLSGSTVRSTFKPAPDNPADDPTDATAPIRHTLVVAANGTATTQAGLYLVGAAANGTIEQRLSATESAALPLGVKLVSDIELTDANGEVVTWLFTETLETREGITNRVTG